MARWALSLIVLTGWSLYGCSPSADQQPSEQVLSREQQNVEDEYTEASQKFQAEYRNLATIGQGCPGRLLEGVELRNRISGLVDRTEAGPHHNGILYHSDGRLEILNEGPGGRPASVFYRYHVEGAFLCVTDDRNSSRKSCDRLIVGDDGSLYREAYVPQRQPPELTCIPLAQHDGNADDTN